MVHRIKQSMYNLTFTIYIYNIYIYAMTQPQDKKNTSHREREELTLLRYSYHHCVKNYKNTTFLLHLPCSIYHNNDLDDRRRIAVSLYCNDDDDDDAMACSNDATSVVFK